MNELIIRAIKNEGVKPPQECLNALDKNFSGAVGVEWFEESRHFEAVFYKDELEYIALFNSNGVLLEYRRIVPQGYLPHAVRHFILKKGEIMNRVLLNRGNEVLYEIIYRDADNKRFMVLLTDLGDIREEKVL
jgi:hypothetical protein